jgi:hypothetical protein
MFAILTDRRRKPRMAAGLKTGGPNSNDDRYGAWLELQMSRLVAVFCIVLVATSLDAQTDPQAMILSGLGDCIKEAISSVDVNDDVLTFSCAGDKAKILYNLLGNKVRAEVVQDRNGKFENRPFGNNACYHRIEDQNGKRSDDFRCDLLMTIGNALSK